MHLASARKTLGIFAPKITLGIFEPKYLLVFRFFEERMQVDIENVRNKEKSEIPYHYNNCTEHMFLSQAKMSP
jgi:hypothetical protein